MSDSYKKDNKATVVAHQLSMTSAGTNKFNKVIMAFDSMCMYISVFTDAAIVIIFVEIGTDSAKILKLPNWKLPSAKIGNL